MRKTHCEFPARSVVFANTVRHNVDESTPMGSTAKVEWLRRFDRKIV
jgi:hypothetical protein